MSTDFVAASEAWKKQVGYISWKHIWHMWLEFTKRWSCSLQIPGLLGLGRITLGPLVSCPVMGVAEVWRATPRYTLRMSSGVMSTLALASIKNSLGRISCYALILPFWCCLIFCHLWGFISERWGLRGDERHFCKSFCWLRLDFYILNWIYLFKDCLIQNSAIDSAREGSFPVPSTELPLKKAINNFIIWVLLLYFSSVFQCHQVK